MYGYKITISVVFFALAGVLVYLNSQRGRAAKIFDVALKAMVGIVVVAFFGVVIILSLKGELAWGSILAGFIPDLSQWTSPAGAAGGLAFGWPGSRAARKRELSSMASRAAAALALRGVCVGRRCGSEPRRDDLHEDL